MIKRFNEYKNDNDNYKLLYNTLYEFSKQNINEESIWTRIKNTAIKTTTAAGDMLVNIANKAKDLLDFAKQIASQIGNYVKTQFWKIIENVKIHILKDNKGVKAITDYIKTRKGEAINNEGVNLGKSKDRTIKAINQIKYLLQYIKNDFIKDLTNKLVELFNNVFKSEKLDENILYEDKESFLQKISNKIMSMEPFSWIPNPTVLLTKSIFAIRDLFVKFFVYVSNKNGKGISYGLDFLFSMFHAYLKVKLNDVVASVEDFTKNFSLSKLLDEVTPTEVTGFIDNIKNGIKNIPYVGDLIGIMNNLAAVLSMYYVYQDLNI